MGLSQSKIAVRDPVFELRTSGVEIEIFQARKLPIYIKIDHRQMAASIKSYLTFCIDNGSVMNILHRMAAIWPETSSYVMGPVSYSYVIEVVCNAIRLGQLAATISVPMSGLATTTVDLMREKRQMAIAPSTHMASSVAGMSFSDRLIKAATMVPDELPASVDAVARKEIADLFSPANIAITAGILVVWAGSHALGVGFVVDGVLLGVGIAFAGWSAFEAFEYIARFFSTLNDAKTDADLKFAAQLMAAAIAILGAACLKVLLRKVTPRSKKAGLLGGDAAPKVKTRKADPPVDKPKKRPRSTTPPPPASAAPKPKPKDTAPPVAKKPKKSAADLLVDGAVPGTRGGKFKAWFDKLSEDDLRTLYADKDAREKIEARLRYPTGYHEWFAVSRAPKIKGWGVDADEIKRFRTKTKDLKWTHPKDGLPGGHGKHGSGTFHNELFRVIDNADNLDEFNAGLKVLRDRWKIDPALLPSFPK